jgi:anti-sigma factor RsiW
MDCRDIKKLLSPYLDGELDEEESKRVASHITSCLDCSLELRELKDTCLLLKEDKEIEPSQDFFPLLLERVNREKDRYTPFRKAYWHLGSLPAFARLTIVLVLGAIIGVWLGSIISLERNAVIKLKREGNLAKVAQLENLQSVPPRSLTQAYINLTSPF